MGRFYVAQTVASTYGSGGYDTSVYNGAPTTVSSGGTTTPTGSSSGGGSPLANTGFDVLLVMTLACVVVFAALVVRFLRRKPTVVAETVEIDED